MQILLRFAACALISIALTTCTATNRIPGYAHYSIGTNPTTLDPALIVDVNGGAIASKIFNGIVRLGDKLEVKPDIAREWKTSKDGLKYTFFLKKGVRFSSGREVRAWDFKYSFERVLDPETKSSQTWIFENIEGARLFMEGKAEEVKGIRVIDDYTLEIRIEKTFSPFLGLLTMPAAYVIPMEEVLRWGADFSSHPLGTGPYVLREWVPNVHLKLDARKDYLEGVPGVKGIIYRIIAEELTAITEFELGNLDVVSIPVSEYSRYKKSSKWKGLISPVEGINTYYLGMNCERPPFNSVRLRRAVNYAIDREKILNTFYEGRAKLASGPVPDILRRWNAPERFTFDREKARTMIKEENLEGKEIELLISADQQVVDIAEVIQAYLMEAGLKVKIKQLEWSAFKDTINRGETDMFWLSWWADYPDPENFLFPTFHSSNHGAGGNRARYANKSVDDFIVKGQHAVSSEASGRYYGEAEKLIVQDAPWVFFWHRTDYILRQPWVKRYDTYPVYSMDKGLGVEL